MFRVNNKDIRTLEQRGLRVFLLMTLGRYTKFTQ